MSDPSDIPPIPPRPAPEEATLSSEPTPASSRSESGVLRRLQALWTLLVRLMILGVSVSLGWLVGVLLAQVAPARHTDPPLQERVMRQSQKTVQKVRALPQWWQGEDSLAITPIAESTLPSDSTADLPPDSPAPSENSSALSDANQPQLTQELTALQQDLNALKAQITELEGQIGQPGSGSVESRLQQLEQRSQPSGNSPPAPLAEPQPTDAPPTAADSPEAPSSEAPSPEASSPEETSDGLGSQAAAPYAEPVFPLVSDRVVLPSALLFEPEGSILTAAGQQLLDSIVPDLRRYGAVTLLVGSHTDGAMEPPPARKLTFQQALAVQQYLEPQLADVGLRWVVLGYGKTRPSVVGEAPGTQQRNQRVEIGIVQP